MTLDYRIDSGFLGTVSGGVSGHVIGWDLFRSHQQFPDAGFGDGGANKTVTGLVSMRFRVIGEAAPDTSIQTSRGTVYAQLFRADGTSSYDAVLRYDDMRHLSRRNSSSGPRFTFTGVVQGELA